MRRDNCPGENHCRRGGRTRQWRRQKAAAEAAESGSGGGSGKQRRQKAAMEEAERQWRWRRQKAAVEAAESCSGQQRRQWTAEAAGSGSGGVGKGCRQRRNAEHASEHLTSSSSPISFNTPSIVLPKACSAPDMPHSPDSPEGLKENTHTASASNQLSPGLLGSE